MVAQASRTVAPLAALALDLDHFKQINDSYGHPTGDAVLAAVGSTLTATVRDGDFVGRAGGEEFLILLPNTQHPRRATGRRNHPRRVRGVAIPTVGEPITASIGIAILPDHAGDATSLLRHADQALYTAKKGGRDRTETFTHETPGPEPLRQPDPPRRQARGLVCAAGRRVTRRHPIISKHGWVHSARIAQTEGDKYPYLALFDRTT